MATGGQDTEIGENVRRFRAVTGLSQAGLAKALTDLGFPFSQQTVLKVEKGTRPLKLTEAATTAEILGVTTDSLLTFDPSPEVLQAYRLDRELEVKYQNLGVAALAFRRSVSALRDHLASAGLSAEERDRSVKPWHLTMLSMPIEDVFSAILGPDRARRVGLGPFLERDDG